MDDLVSRQAAIDAIEHRLAEPAYQHTGEDWYDGMNCAESELYELPSAEPRWIPVTERLPEKYIGKWLCCTDDGDIIVLPYDTPGDGSKQCVFYKWDNNGYFYQTFNVVAWMPLPKPWKGEDDG